MENLKEIQKAIFCTEFIPHYSTVAEKYGLEFDLKYFNIEDGSALYTFKA